jgi:hypothetical protein
VSGRRALPLRRFKQEAVLAHVVRVPPTIQDVIAYRSLAKASDPISSEQDLRRAILLPVLLLVGQQVNDWHTTLEWLAC